MSALADPELAKEVAGRYERYSPIAGVLLTAAWHLGFDLPGTLGGLSQYRWPWAAVAGWVLYSAGAVVFAQRLIRWRPGPQQAPWPVAWAWSGAVAALAISVLVLQACPTHAEITPADWGWGSVGWLAALALWHRPIREFVAALVANALLTLGAIAVRSALDEGVLAAWLMVVVGSIALQAGFGAGARRLISTSADVVARSAQIAREAAEQEQREAVRQAAARLAHEVHADVLPLLKKLAAGASPQEERMRHRCAVAAARVRRLILASRGSPDPLRDELGAGADLAARRGVVVDLEVHGILPQLPQVALLALTQAPLEALARARSWARVTVAGWDDRVVVSVVSDGPLMPLPRSVLVDTRGFATEEGLWLESSWRRR